MGNIKPVYGDEAREGLFKGITMLNDAVKVTLGPLGRNVLMRKMHQGIHPTKDGVSVAKRINFSDELLNMGANLVKQASSATNDDAGDGTTTSTLLAHALVDKGLIWLRSHPRANSVEVKRGMDAAVKVVLDALPEYAQKIDGDIEKIRSVATISANNDTEIGNIIADSLERMGIDAYIKVEESHTNDTYVDIVQGMQFDSGYASPYFVTDSDAMQVSYDTGCDVVICEDKLTERDQLEPVLRYAKAENRPVLIIANDFTEEILGVAVYHKLRSGTKISIVKSPFFGVAREAYLDDLSVLIGAHVMSKNTIPIQQLQVSHIGSVDKCIITKETTLLINGHGDPEDVNKWIKYIESSDAPSEKEKEDKAKRLSMLKGGIAVLYVGAASEAEVKEKRDRVDDALSATKAAIEEGIVEGGGIALLRLSSLLPRNRGDNKDFNAGYEIVREAIKQPFKQILLNAGYTDDSITDLETSLITNLVPGINAATQKECDMFVEGIVDPTKVTRVALQNAVSVAGVVITTECVLIDESLQQRESDLPAFLQD